MHEPKPIRVEPTPTDDEAAAIVAALSAYLAERRAARAEPAPPARPWALAGRLESHGQTFARLHGLRVGWGNAARLARRSPANR
jgi:hypothetical protein